MNDGSTKNGYDDSFGIIIAVVPTVPRPT